MQVVGWIDRGIFKAAGLEALTDEVVLTYPQMQHITEEHPQVYESYGGLIADILANPDYIIEANRGNSAVLLKEFSEEDARFQLVLRLKIEEDPIEFKNSIITFWKIEEKRYRRYLRTKKVLYKRE